MPVAIKQLSVAAALTALLMLLPAVAAADEAGTVEQLALSSLARRTACSKGGKRIRWEFVLLMLSCWVQIPFHLETSKANTEVTQNDTHNDHFVVRAW